MRAALPFRLLQKILGFTALLLCTAASTWAQAPTTSAEAGSKSWISIGESRKGAIQTPGDGWTEGDDWLVTVEYYLDPAEATSDTQLQLTVLGPWIDNPDGKYTTKRHEERYPGLGGSISVKAGAKGKHEFAMKLPAAKTGTGMVGDSVSFLANFRNGTKAWPWSVRAPGVWFARKGGYFELLGSRPGNLYFYNEQLTMFLRPKVAALDGATHRLKYRVLDVAGKEVFSDPGSLEFKFPTPQQEGDLAKRPQFSSGSAADQKIAFVVGGGLKLRGTYALEVTIDGWETRSATFAVIPDLMKITGGAKTRFGMTGLVGPKSDTRAADLLTIARQLGFTSCRAWLKWDEIEPAEGEWRDLQAWDKGLELGRQKGIDTWLLLEAPPKWAVAGAAKNFNYAAFPFRDERLRKTVTTLGQRFKGKILGWEWLNEIVPGEISPDPVADYLRFCQVATGAAKAVDPQVITTLAGGLWPRSFRRSLLAAGVGKYIDVLPVHYSDGDGIREARRDLDEVGQQRVRVWDNESAAGLSTWNMPLAEALQVTSQSEWILSRWTDELMAGADRIVYFGGQGDPAGNWSYLWADLSPRPVATTMAVFAAKTFGVKPVGIFTLGEGSVFHLFETARGEALMVAGTITKGGEKVVLDARSQGIVLTNHQGAEQKITATGAVELPLPEGHVFVEGADLDVMKAQVVPQVQGGNDAPDPRKLAQLQMLTGQPAECVVRLRNVYARELAGTLQASLPAGWGASAAVPFKLAPGAEGLVKLALPVAPTSSAGRLAASVEIRYDWEKLPVVTKPFYLSVVSPELLGNLLKNGGFEEGAKPQSATGWSGGGMRVTSTGPDLGHGSSIWKYENSPAKYLTLSQGRAVPSGGKYLYTAWVKTQELAMGSNVNLEMADGTKQTLTNVKVFTTPPTVQDWEVVTAVLNTPTNLKHISVTPLAKGTGTAFFDNLRLTPVRGDRLCGRGAQADEAREDRRQPG